ncbi:hypothetical protein [Evansella halocellulosilytica]|uniref:hypothetical protein n=1 Tax=Evansella halocellulosilytica TaxID=2011013 RepID=UPI000BB9B455|nr:hypothetical protein [Evansella halocellulosilytica]
MIGWEQAADKLIKVLNKAGYEAYIVGGAVRDRILQRPVKDIDLTTNASIESVQQLFPHHIDVGAKHGTVLVQKSGNRSPGSIEEDLSLRDYTINAMAINSEGVLIDPFDGKKDLHHKVLKVVNHCKKRLTEDPLRSLRGVRFSLHYDLQFDPFTKSLIDSTAPMINQIAVERIRSELDKIASEHLSKEKVSVLIHSSVIQQLPHFFSNKSEWLNKIQTYKMPFSIDRPLELWLMATIENRNSHAFHYYRCSNKLKKEAIHLTKAFHDLIHREWTNELVYRIGYKNIPIIEKLRALWLGEEKKVSDVYTIYGLLPIKNRQELVINGKDIVSFFPNIRGSLIGEYLRNIEHAVVNQEVKNNKNDIFEWLKRRV